MLSIFQWLEDVPTLDAPISQACTYDQMQSPIYAQWCEKIKEQPHLHRKQWEFIYILQSLSYYGALKAGNRGLGFGVGQEPLPAYFASIGIDVVATDLPLEEAKASGWVDTNQHADCLEQLNSRHICDPELFRQRVTFDHADMNHIPEHYTDFDFNWSSCCFEHLGSIDAGLAFIENNLKTLKSGGIAVHTTELNCTSNTDTLSKGSTVLFRKRDFKALIASLRKKGHAVEATFRLGKTQADTYVDVPPYTSHTHLKLQLGKFVSTSFGLIVKKDGLIKYN